MHQPLSQTKHRRLTGAAFEDKLAFESIYRDDGCNCHFSPPCGYCTHPGNPSNLAENESAWEECDDLQEIIDTADEIDCNFIFGCCTLSFLKATLRGVFYGRIELDLHNYTVSCFPDAESPLHTQYQLYTTISVTPITKQNNGKESTATDSQEGCTQTDPQVHPDSLTNHGNAIIDPGPTGGG